MKETTSFKKGIKLSNQEWVQELYGHYYRESGKEIEVAVLHTGLECILTTTLARDDIPLMISEVEDNKKLSVITNFLVEDELDSAQWNDYSASSMEDDDSLSSVIKELGLPPLLDIPNGEISNMWTKYNFPIDPIPVSLGRRKDEKIFESIHFSCWDNKAFIHYNTARLGTVTDRADYFIEFVEDLKRNPTSFIEAQAYESTTHGASGMMKNHYDLLSLEEINDILSSYEVSRDLFLTDEDVVGLLK
jgi:hypothetical protein